jgi:hypothetical protein
MANNRFSLYLEEDEDQNAMREWAEILKQIERGEVTNRTVQHAPWVSGKVDSPEEKAIKQITFEEFDISNFSRACIAECDSYKSYTIDTWIPGLMSYVGFIVEIKDDTDAVAFKLMTS